MKKKVLSLLLAVSLFTAASCSKSVDDRDVVPETERTFEETTTEEVTTTTTEETTTTTTTEATTTTSETTAETSETSETSSIAQMPSDGLDFSYTTSDPVITSEEDGLMEVEFYRDGLCMRSKIYLPDEEGPYPTVIVATGLRISCDRYQELAENYAQNGIACVLFDFIGGPESGSHSDGEAVDMCLTSETKDLNAVLDGVLELDIVDKDNIFLFGHSFGGEVATVTAALRGEDINSLILMEPAYLLDDVVSVLIPDGVEIPESVPYPFFLGHDFIEEMLLFDIYEYIPLVVNDVILFKGTVEDALGLLAPEYYDRAEDLFPSVTMVDVEGANHAFDGDAGVTMFNSSLTFIGEHLV